MLRTQLDQIFPSRACRHCLSRCAHGTACLTQHRTRHARWQASIVVLVQIPSLGHTLAQTARLPAIYGLHQLRKAQIIVITVARGRHRVAVGGVEISIFRMRVLITNVHLVVACHVLDTPTRND